MASPAGVKVSTNFSTSGVKCFSGSLCAPFARLAAARGARVFLYHFTRSGDSPAQTLGAFHGSQGPFFSWQPTLESSLGRTPYDLALARQ